MSCHKRHGDRMVTIGYSNQSQYIWSFTGPSAFNNDRVEQNLQYFIWGFHLQYAALQDARITQKQSWWTISCTSWSGKYLNSSQRFNHPSGCKILSIKVFRSWPCTTLPASWRWTPKVINIDKLRLGAHSWYEVLRKGVNVELRILVNSLHVVFVDQIRKG